MQQRVKICAYCSREIHGYPATSRKDNTTKICPFCALLEAVHEYAQWEMATYSSVKNSCFLKCEHNRKIGENDGLTCQDGGEVWEGYDYVAEGTNTCKQTFLNRSEREEQCTSCGTRRERAEKTNEPPSLSVTDQRKKTLTATRDQRTYRSNTPTIRFTKKCQDQAAEQGLTAADARDVYSHGTVSPATAKTLSVFLT